MSDVAARVGVSRPTVSMVMRGLEGPSEETRRKVLLAADELGYAPDTSARLLRRQRSLQLGVVFTMREPFHVELVEHLYSCAAARGYDLALGALTPTREQDRVVEELVSHRCEGLILLDTESGTAPLGAVAAHLPAVQLACPVADKSLDVVRSDDAKGIRQAVDHLVELGHRAIAHVDAGNRPGAAERRRGYRAGMKRHGLAGHADIIPGDYTREAGAAAAQQLLERTGRPTAVITANDDCALGLIDSLVRAGVDVPGDLSVVGYDDSSVARLPFLNLTTVRQDAARLAELAVDAVLDRLEAGRTEARKVTLAPRLVVRGTTAPPA
ncbi:LacI family DNA-binding transcriptional regulator [Saccharopolyspora erythraea]|uniref:LacI family DNA-binding transcriptional regulator n=1 Tax=Saccharopolyspora erythraea TaxID=1836 RepID=UPI001BABAA89|nr:LacI family DNA-binding transcriptional regulator [Saccharopolyspora erythraea]QUH02316.1 LacI family DNA-binding transcriptional regulator [Saccharopolyspora erythraea]